ncbi:integrase [Halovivax asiaticus JCM 14624]|uniref:Integrase n=1 Tax=Halovivax asiaticus JCM 14624 TaxID=1227490 RepID=M0BE04_9EURY|nr:site-specific integrase [Halovivax asiaticus]ELZ08513.1 integrase [Halovivax asiaticus JCM 14624]
MSSDDRLDELADEIVARLDDEDLEPTAPTKAFELWTEQLDRADSTIESYRYRVKPFLEFCANEGITSLDQLTTRKIKEFEGSRRGADLKRQTINNQFGTLKQFLRYCIDLNAVSEEVVASLDVPDLSKEDRVNTEKLIAKRAHTILDNLERYRYASRDHVLFLLLWRTGARIGTIYSLDVEDVYRDDDDRERLRTYLEEDYSPSVVEQILEDASLPFIFPRHRPETDTRLKNEIEGERVINVADWVADVVQDYIDVNRADQRDEHGREPLLSSRKGNGRLSKSAMRNWIYVITQPCEFGGPCPHDRDPETCEAREHGHGSKCPSSRSPHKMRTGSITWHRDRGWPVSDLSDKANSGEDLIQGVYDQPEKLVRGASRRQHLNKLDEDNQ